MPLQALLSDVHPDWYAGGDDQALDPGLVAQARGSMLGRRMLVRSIPASNLEGLLAPRPGGTVHRALLQRWPRERVRLLVRDLGVLAYAPVIRAEIRREPVRWLRSLLGSSYLLALDKTVWDGRVDRDTLRHLSADWEALVADPRFLADAEPLRQMLGAQGRAELQAWALLRNRPLADWSRLMHDDVPLRAAHLPEKSVLQVVSHHENRDEDAA